MLRQAKDLADACGKLASPPSAPEQDVLAPQINWRDELLLEAAKLVTMAEEADASGVRHGLGNFLAKSRIACDARAISQSDYDMLQAKAAALAKEVET